MRRSRVLPALAALVVAGAVIAGCGSSSTSSTSPSTGTTAAKSNKPIIIGAAVDLTSTMKAFDGPALNAAQLEVKKINAAGGVDGRRLVFDVENDKLVPAQTRADALDVLSKGANILWVTCDVDFATPSTEVGLTQKLLTVSPCISTDQMGPKRFGSAGNLAFTFGSIAQDEGAALAQFADSRGSPAEVVHLDLSGLQFCDAAALHAMIELTAGGSRPVVLHNPSAALRALIRITGWDELPGLTVVNSP